MLIKINFQPSGGKAWAARITGRHPKFSFEREFLPVFSADRSSSGKTGSNTYELSPGEIYEVNEPWRGRYFVDGEGHRIDTEDVLKYINRKEKNQ
jgi:hypothetical protein